MHKNWNLRILNKYTENLKLTYSLTTGRKAQTKSTQISTSVGQYQKQ